MKFIMTLVFFVTICCVSLGQESFNDSVVDTKYREDQFYIGTTYNILINKPNNIKQSGFSLGFHLGFIRDFPINKKRSYAIGLGLGLSTNSFNQNIGISKLNGKTNFTTLDQTNTEYRLNRLNTHLVEVPLELRWRNSTPETFKFWRIYPGFKVGYVFASASKYRGLPENIRLTNINAINKVQYGITLSTGYNTWNFHAYYALNTLFKDTNLTNGNPININVIKAGLMFYIF